MAFLNQNPILDEIDQAHSMLSPPAQQAIALAHAGIGRGIPEGPGATPPPDSAPPVASPASAPRPIATPATAVRGLGPAPAPQDPAQAARIGEFNRLTAAPLTGDLAHTKADTGLSGIGQVHSPIARGLLHVAEGIGGAFLPGITQAIPGTELHHNMLVRHAASNINQDEAQKTAVAGRAHQAAEDAHLGAEDAKLGKPTPETPHTTTVNGKVMQFNQQTGKFDIPVGDANQKLDPFTEWRKANPGEPLSRWMETEALKTSPKEGEMPLGNDRVQQVNNMLTSRFQVLNPGKALPSQYAVPANATQKDYDRIDKALESEERAAGTKAQQDQISEMRKQTATLAQTARADAAEVRNRGQLDHEVGQYGKPFETMSAGVSSQLDKILDAEKMVVGGAMSQALGIPKILTALVSGAGSGVRITQAELNSIAHARGIGGDIEGFFNRIKGQGTLTDEQKRQMGDILHEVRARITQKQQIANDTLDKIKGATSRDQILAAEKDGRKALADMETPQGGQQGAGAKPPAVGAVVDGHKFKGGDPSKPESWEKVTNGRQ